MPNYDSTRELDSIEERHMHRRPGTSLMELDVAGALDELLEALEALTPVERLDHAFA